MPLSERARSTLLAATLAAAAAAGYVRALEAPLVFDDLHLLERVELHATALSPAQLSRAAAGFPSDRWLAYVTFAVNHAVHGLRPFGYHAVNVAVHVLVAILFFRVGVALLDRLGLGDGTRRRRAAFLAALLFAVHPVQTMAVTYVIQRMTSLGTLMALAAMAVWFSARRTGPPGAPAVLGAVALTYLAFSCKENFVIVPALVLLVEWCAGLDLRAAVARHPVPWALASAAALGVLLLIARAYWPVILAEQGTYGVSAGERLLTQGRVLWHYLSLLVLPLPHRLQIDHAWVASTGPWTPPTTLPALVGVLALAVAAGLARARAPLVSLAVGWFLVALVVEQSVLPIDFVFEHRLYFAALGLFLLAGWVISGLRPPALVPVVALPLALALLAGTAARNEVWRDPARLFAEAAAAGGGPGRARALVNSAVALRRAGRLEDAAATLRDAHRLAPAWPEPLANLGNVASEQGRPAEAERWYREALARDPGRSDVLYNLGVLLAAQGRTDEAIDAYRAAVRTEPRNSDARVNLAALLADARGDTVGALALLDETLSLDPGSVLALVNRAMLAADAGRVDGALADARQAARLAPGDPNAWYALAHVHRARGRSEDAREAAGEALRLQPEHPEARALLEALGVSRPATSRPRRNGPLRVRHSPIRRAAARPRPGRPDPARSR